MATSYKVLNGEGAKSKWRPLKRQNHLIVTADVGEGSLNC